MVHAVTELINSEDLALLPEELQIIVKRFKQYTMMNSSDSGIVLQVLIDSRKRVTELEAEIRQVRTVHKEVQDSLLERICELEAPR